MIILNNQRILNDIWQYCVWIWRCNLHASIPYIHLLHVLYMLWKESLNIDAGHSTATRHRANCPSNCISLQLLCFQKWKCQSESKIPHCFAGYSTLAPLTSYNLKQKRPGHMELEIQVLAWDRHKNVASLSRLMRTEISPSDNWISDDKYKQPTKNTVQIGFHTRRLHFTLKNEWRARVAQWVR